MSGSIRAFLIGLVLLTALTAGVVLTARFALDPDSLKPRLIEAAKRATGRTLTIAGPMGVKLSLVPTIWMEDVTLSNPPGFSRPDMVKVARVELSLNLLPLLRHDLEVEHIVLMRPDVLLEGDPAGPGNWTLMADFAGAPVEATPEEEVTPAERASPSPAQAGAPKPAFTTTLKDISVEDGRIGWIDLSGHEYAMDIPRLNFTEPAVRLTQISGTVVHDGRPVDITARTGSPDELRSAFGAAPWPVTIQLRSGDASVTVDGKIAHPLEGRGYGFTVDADLPDPAAFASWFPGQSLASLRGVVAHAEFNDGGGPFPGLTALAVKIASASLDKIAHGVTLTDVTLSARGASPLQVSSWMAVNGRRFGIMGTAGDLNWLIHGGSAPMAIDLAWSAASAHGTVKGSVRTPRQFSGFALNVDVDVPDPSQVLDGAPPALKSVALQARLTDGPGAVPFQFTSNAGDLEGDLAVTRSPRLSVSGTVSSRRLNLDMLRGSAAVEPSPPGLPDVAPPDPVAGISRGPMFPDTKLPLDWIRSTDADVKVSLGHVRFGGTDIATVNAALTMKDGVLRLDPFTAEAPDQHLNAALMVDAAAVPPRFHLTVDSPGLASRPLLAALNLPQVADGTLELHADVTGRGDSPRALAASVDGRGGMAIEGGQLDARLVNSWLEALRPLRIDAADATDLRCFAVRADAKSGVVTIQPAALDTAALIVEANGDVDLTHETLALRVRPRTKIGGTGIALPVRVSGPLRAPSARIDISGKGFAGGALAGLLIGGKDVMGAAGGGDPCPEALARAREGAAAVRGAK